MAQYQISIPPLNLFYVSNLYGKFFFDSTISHIGFLLLSLAINTEQSIDSFLFYLIQYTITNLNIFLIILAVTYSIYTPTHTQHNFKELNKINELGSNRIHKESEYNYDYYRESNSYRTTNNNTLISHTKLGQQIDIRYIYELKGLFFTNPLLSLSLCISLFSMAGIPPVKNSGKILYWEKLSNSGDTLKFMIPNYSRKAICGWTNYSGMVTSHNMNENEMGYRGSKSVLVSSTVKEQRVDGSWFIKHKLINLRYTLTGCESSYQIKIPSKQLKNQRTFSTVNIQPKLNPWFVTGLSDFYSYWLKIRMLKALL